MIRYDNCFFRTKPKQGEKKALIQVTNKCNLQCVHCFVDSNESGELMTLEFFNNHIIPFITSNNIKKVTLTGGEPLLNTNLLEMTKVLSDFCESITICTNGTLLNENQIIEYCKSPKVSFNVSLDGFTSESHDQFRRKTGTFIKTKANIELLSKYKLLKGILVTPNRFANSREYIHLINFAFETNAKYVLFNPLSSFGRGEKNYLDCALTENELKILCEEIIQFHNPKMEVYFANMPSEIDTKHECCINDIRYVYVNGEIVFCPYIDFSNEVTLSTYIENRGGNVLSKNYKQDCKMDNREIKCLAKEMGNKSNGEI